MKSLKQPCVSYFMRYNNAMKVILNSLLLCLLLLMPAYRAIGAEEKTISGIVTDMDWVSSTITVRYFNLDSGNNDEINIKVTGGSKMVNGTSSISLSNIQQSDPVTVTYYDDGLSGLKIIRLSDLNSANR